MNWMQETGQADGDSGIALVVFCVGPLRFAVASRHIRSIADLDHSRDERVPALADLLGLAPAPGSPQIPGSRERLLRVSRATQDRTVTFDIRVEEPVALCRTPIGALYPLPALVAALSSLPCVRGFVRVSATDAEALAVLLDPRRLLEADRLESSER